VIIFLVQLFKKNNMKLLKGYHITATEKKHISHLISNNILAGKIGRKIYFISEKGNNVFDVAVTENAKVFAWDYEPKKRTHKITIQI